MEQKLARKYPLLGSSVNPEKISLTLKSLIPLLVLLASALHLDLTETNIEELVSAIGVAITAGFTLYGVIRKIYYKIKK